MCVCVCLEEKKEHFLQIKISFLHRVDLERSPLEIALCSDQLKYSGANRAAAACQIIIWKVTP